MVYYNIAFRDENNFFFIEKMIHYEDRAGIPELVNNVDEIQFLITV